MTAAPFTPVGDRARWRIIYDALAVMRPGDVLTYEHAARLLDLHPDDDRHTIQSAIRDAARRNETDNKHALEAVPNIGYRVVLPAEHARLAKHYQRRSVVALKSGRSKVVNVDMNGLDPDTRRVYEVMAVAMSQQLDFNRRMDIRQRRLERVVAATVEKTERSSEEVAELRARLERLELKTQ